MQVIHYGELMRVALGECPEAVPIVTECGPGEFRMEQPTSPAPLYTQHLTAVANNCTKVKMHSGLSVVLLWAVLSFTEALLLQFLLLSDTGRVSGRDYCVLDLTLT